MWGERSESHTNDGLCVTFSEVKMEKRFEAALLRLAAWILDRNVQRAMVVSRRDNNWLFEVAHELRSIACRIEAGYGA